MVLQLLHLSVSSHQHILVEPTLIGQSRQLPVCFFLCLYVYRVLEITSPYLICYFYSQSGYVMFFLWSMLCICYVLFFEEPERNDPIEIKQILISKEIQLVNGETLSTSHAEKKPLLSLGASNSNGVKCVQPQRLLRSCGNVPVLISLLLLVLLKAVLEGLSSSAPTVSRYYFGWGVHANGIFLAVLASCVLPTNIFVAHISRRFDDRELITATLVVMLFGILGILNYGEGSKYSEVRFVLFGLVIFVSCNALEGPTMVSSILIVYRHA